MSLWTPPGAELRSTRQEAADAVKAAVRAKACRDLNRARHLLMRSERRPLGSNGRRKDVREARALAGAAEVALKGVGNELHQLKGAQELIQALINAK